MAEAQPHTIVRASRLEAFSDGVLAIIITIMVLEIHAPEGKEIADWVPLIPIVLAYLFSFTFIAIYWNNHHHLLRATKHITPSVMWTNMLLLFTLSLIPVATAWLGENGNYLETWPVVVYSAVSLSSGLAFYLLTVRIVKANPHDSRLDTFVASRKGAASPFLYVGAIVVAFFVPIAGIALLVVSAALWFIPDRTLIED